MSSDRTLKVRKDNPEVLYLAHIVDFAGRKVALTELGKRFHSPPTPTTVFVSSGEVTADDDLAPGQDLQSIWRSRCLLRYVETGQVSGDGVADL